MSEPKKQNPNTYNPSFSFQGEPEAVDVEQEVQDTSLNSLYDAHRLADFMIQVGERMMGVSLYDYQKPLAFRIFFSMLSRDGAEITALFSRQSGKSETVVFCAITMGILLPVLAKYFPKELGHFSNGVKMGLMAPTDEQVDTVYARCMEKLLSDNVKEFLADPDIDDATLSSAKFKLRSGSFLTPQSAAKQSKVESKTYHIVFLDESQDIDTEKVRRSIIPMTASTFGTIFRSGTPGRYTGDFYYTIKQNKVKDKKLRGAKASREKRLHFEFNYKKVIESKKAQYARDGKEFHLLYEKAVNRDKESMGEHSDFFRMAYKIEWLLDVGMFIGEEELAQKVYAPRIGFPELHKTDFVVAGLDIAKARNSTVLTKGIVDFPATDFGIRPKKTIAGWLLMQGTNYEEQLQLIMSDLLNSRVQVLYADCTGVGRVLTDMLEHYMGDYMEIVPYLFTPSSKSDMWKSLEEDIDSSRIILPANGQVKSLKEFKMFEEQMINFQKHWKGSFMVCEKTQGYDDDFCDSLGLMNLAGNHLYIPPSTMEVTDGNFLSTERGSIIRGSQW